MRRLGFFLMIVLIFVRLIGEVEAADIVITEVNGLQFPTLIDEDVKQTITVAATDPGAAVFYATGDPNDKVTVTVLEATSVVEMHHSSCAPSCTRSRYIVKLKKFKTGGELTKKGVGQFNGSGDLTNMRIGATAVVGASDVAGMYSATLTLNVVYQ